MANKSRQPLSEAEKRRLAAALRANLRKRKAVAAPVKPIKSGKNSTPD
jgi:hypothetical protein